MPADDVVPNHVRAIRLKRAADVPAAFTQAAVAARAGVSVTTLRKWEAGTTRPRQRAAKRLAKALGVSLDDLGFPPPDDQAGVVRNRVAGEPPHGSS